MIWYQYREKVVYNEDEFYTYFNYIQLNPIKHGLVDNLKELKDYKFCSYKTQLKKFGPEKMNEVVSSYLIRGVNIYDG